MTSFQCRSHDFDIPRRVECEITSSISHFDQFVDDGRSFWEVFGVDKVGYEGTIKEGLAIRVSVDIRLHHTANETIA